MELLSNFLQAALRLVNSVPSEAWELIIEMIVSAVVVSPAVLGAKKLWQVHSDKIMLALTIVGSLLAGVVSYLHGLPEFGPWFTLVQGWLIFATTQPVYRFLVKPLFRRLGAWFSAKMAQAYELQQAEATAHAATEAKPAVVNDFVQ